jgi:polyketide cyclase/dehydrase/lipid transport protein
MSEYRQQALIHAPVERVWELVGNPARHPVWLPRVVEVRGDSFDVGDVYVQVTRNPIGEQTTSLLIDRLEELRELDFHCTKTGMYMHWSLTPAQGDTFVETEFGMKPMGTSHRVLDATLGRMYFRRWVNESLEALAREAAPG